MRFPDDDEQDISKLKGGKPLYLTYFIPGSANPYVTSMDMILYMAYVLYNFTN
jgi:hypothetical protein